MVGMNEEWLANLIETVASEVCRRHERSILSQPYYTEEEAADVLRLTPTQLRDLRRKGDIKYSRIVKNRVRYTRQQLDDYMKTRETVGV